MVSVSETIDHLPVPRLYLGLFPILLVGVVYTLAGVVALLTNTEPAHGWMIPVFGVLFLVISAHKLYTTSSDDDSVADYWIVLQYFFALVLLVSYASGSGLISL
ncbi:hypothetical protein C447_12400 [Halococcus hamelinensis 100A6]|uniref:Uncharacterized protein n=1 Tax=Halococcus hamelinensis 100A6 TaxID=1132509 RepID=M0LZH0_9EURY|nr:hypothetical protein C447_12400 [Halococcus hamelinensis 100A6]